METIEEKVESFKEQNKNHEDVSEKENFGDRISIPLFFGVIGALFFGYGSYCIYHNLYNVSNYFSCSESIVIPFAAGGLATGGIIGYFLKRKLDKYASYHQKNN
jgi:surface polysaccharide O-acyltransferase-like enzyme